MEALVWFLAVVAVLAGFGWYLSFLAFRLDRLHHRVESARSALGAQQVRRAQAALAIVASDRLDPASGLLVADAAAEALEAGDRYELELATQAENARAMPDAALTGGADAAEREMVESTLTRVLNAALDDPDTVDALRADVIGEQLLATLSSASARLALARRIVNNAVTDARRVRHKRLVRWLRLAGRAGVPRTVEIDDTLHHQVHR